MKASASRWDTAWKEPMGRPNCSRVRAYSAVSASAPSHVPSCSAHRATSVADLCAATGLRPGSLYAAFTDKETLFRRAFGRDADHFRSTLPADLSGLAAITAWLDTLPFDFASIDLDDVWASAGDFLTSASFGQGALAGVSATASFFTGLALMIVPEVVQGLFSSVSGDAPISGGSIPEVQ